MFKFCSSLLSFCGMGGRKRKQAAAQPLRPDDYELLLRLDKASGGAVANPETVEAWHQRCHVTGLKSMAYADFDRNGILNKNL